MIWTYEGYRVAALERIGEANAMRRERRYVLAMYLAGLAAECMLRAWHHPDLPFNERHDIARLFSACDLDRLGDSAVRRLRPAVQTIHALWLNSYRFAHEAQVRRHLHELGLDRELRRTADSLKVRCGDLFDASAEVVTVGGDRWRRKP
jgi:hypothetical protein